MLTTLAKVKLSLGITDTSKDTLLTDFIAQVSAFIESACGGRKFEAVERTEYYDYPDGNNVFLKNYPIVEAEPFTLSYRTGTISVPVWVAYTADDFLIYPEEGFAKFVSQFGGSVFSPTEGYRALQIIYTGGFLIDFANETDPLLHNLPADLTLLATQLCAFLYNTKSSQGIKSESTEGQSITYSSGAENGLSLSNVTTAQQIIITRYTRIAMGV